MYLPGFISALIGGIFMKICILEATNIHNTQNRVCWDRSKIIVMLHNLGYICLVSVWFVYLKISGT